ncbi:MAG: hypothetical protein KGQ68_08940 [Gammaproteobacteria bacterium]|nr:hypothetical protein [Gammaproteobacteria bacterium]
MDKHERWGTFEDAEYWRKEEFLRRSPEQRLDWLREMLVLAYRSGAIKPDEQSPKEQ